MKVVVIGASLSGKTSVVRYLRETSKLPVLEIDEELTRLNGGSFPTDNERKHSVLAPQIIKDVVERDNVVFFTNTDYFTPEDLRMARSNGFTIVQLDLNLDELQKRNKVRVENEGYADLSEWLEGMVQYQEEIRKKGLVDKVIDANHPIKEIAREIVGF